MKLQILSDLHEEFRGQPWLTGDKIVPEADAILLAGDITNTKVADEQLAHYKTLGKPFFYILGNHEYYSGWWDNIPSIFRELCSQSNIRLLEDETAYLDDGRIRLIGATLWTDFWISDNGGREHQGNYCLRGMACLSAIKGFSISKWEDKHKRSLDYIKLQLSTKHDGPTIVMTHHLPTAKSSHPRFKGSKINGGFYSELDHVIEEYQPDYWIHGHTHDCFDYKIGSTRVLCNPKGYENIYMGVENVKFNPSLIIEV
jgi:predicted phosphodiesterase